ncbi:tyrosine-type recombinase/integrase [Flavobacterium rhizosphaerae]|uniref:Tyrosine-type recombinase/integrase n=1 Tax=Flavobacterium rhizosphaerae TaxID=3163298 RepID=A0ABW8YWV6_9FLAO
MKDLLNGCSYSDIWVSPTNWKTTKKLTGNWYIQCQFYDPLFSKKYPEGFPFRKKLNRIKNLEARRAAVALLLNEIPKLFEEKGYNPITKVFMARKIDNQTLISPETEFIEALKYALTKVVVSEYTMRDLKVIVNNIEKAVKSMQLDLPLKNVNRLLIKQVLERLPMTPYKYNKYLTHLSILYNELVELEALEYNYIRDIRKRKTVKKIREVLTPEERKKVFVHLKANYTSFWVFMIIYFHSGGRITELLNLKVRDINLTRQYYRTVIKKGSHYREVDRPIKDIALEFWSGLIKDAEPDMYVFAENLEPGHRDKPIRIEQITRRWRTHVKQQLDITADFSSLKHSNLTETVDELSAQLAAKLAGHTTTTMVNRHYDVNKEAREMEILKRMKNHFIPAD